MGSKINFSNILKDHFKTLSDIEGKWSFVDILTFFVFPSFVAAVSIFERYNIKPDIVALLVNFGSIFTALLLSVLMLVYEQQNKLEDKHQEKSNNGGVPFFQEKLKLLKQLYCNISYAVVTSVFLVVFSLIQSLFYKKSIAVLWGWMLNFHNRFSIYLLTPILLFLTVNVILTILMIVKRTYALLCMKI
ncbi:hypothetical protein [Paludibacterium yongneupense]|uniref:hypothetical protein n=1 Tax=Paludibacterium yongneupense TaxID=400061 RepID=UPI0012EBE8E5|nr:hypothetical protein [Paludibacterium yongneupense]